MLWLVVSLCDPVNIRHMCVNTLGRGLDSKMKKSKGLIDDITAQSQKVEKSIAQHLGFICT
jgi:hypothetical protein